MLSHMSSERTESSAVVVAWNIVGYLLYVGLVGAGVFGVWMSLFFGMATDACGDAACDASYRIWPAMIIIWAGVGTVLLTTLIVMVRNSSRGKVVVVWPVVGLLALVFVYAVAAAVLH